MRVVDASLIIDAFSGRGERGIRALRALLNGRLVAPSHVDLEAIGAWRKQAFSGHLNAEDSRAAIDALGSLDIQRVPHEPLLERIWELRENVTPADAAYVALAEELGAPLLTTDARLTRAVGPRCQFELIE